MSYRICDICDEACELIDADISSFGQCDLCGRKADHTNRLLILVTNDLPARHLQRLLVVESNKAQNEIHDKLPERNVQQLLELVTEGLPHERRDLF